MEELINQKRKESYVQARLQMTEKKVNSTAPLAFVAAVRHWETFGGELLVNAVRQGFRVSEITYEPPRRRSKPRIGGTVRANFRIMAAAALCSTVYLF